MGAKHKLDVKYHDREIDVIVSGGEALAALRIEGNRHLLITALFNLLDNASKFSSFQPVTVGVELLANNIVQITIQDKGIGIPAGDLKQIREPFHRAQNARQLDGTGLGIPLTAKVIDLHGGSFLVESTLNAGTIAKVMLPVL
jgi:signal transduction histidine kinase